jgi:flagellar motility protein MotE (MotC chaperone)
MALSDTAAETDIDRLTRVYETMEPDAAAPLFAQMEPSFAAGFLVADVTRCQCRADVRA